MRDKRGQKRKGIIFALMVFAISLATAFLLSGCRSDDNDSTPQATPEPTPTPNPLAEYAGQYKRTVLDTGEAGGADKAIGDEAVMLVLGHINTDTNHKKTSR